MPAEASETYLPAMGCCDLEGDVRVITLAAELNRAIESSAADEAEGELVIE